MGMFGKVKSLAYHDSNAEDPYITMQENDEDDEDREELQILATDNMVLAAKVEDEVAHLEVYVYEDESDNLSSADFDGLRMLNDNFHGEIFSE